MTETNPRDLIDAFVDGEAVDPRDLVRALAVEGDREYFADVLVLRRLARGPRAMAPAAPLAAAGSMVIRKRPSPGPRWWAAAAAMAVLAAAGGYVAALQPVHDDAAPAPTAVIKLERGVDWDERFGGS
jgi:hypothetical protein